MNDVPLVNKNDINSINTSIIAIKKQLRQLNEAVGLIDTPDVNIDLTPFVKKSDVVNTVQSGNLNPVTSNAVATVLSYSTSEQFTGAYWIDGKPIYKKTVSTDITTFKDNGTTRSFSLSSFVTNADSLVKAEGFWIWSEIGTSGTLNRKIILGGVTFGSNNLVLWSSDVYTSPSTNAINAYFYVYKSLYDIRKIKVRINVFYTKTTDTATRSIPTEKYKKS